MHSQDYCSLVLSSSLPEHFRDSCDQGLLSVGGHRCQHAARMNQNTSSEESIEIYWQYADKKDKITKSGLNALTNKLCSLLVPVVQMMDSAIHRINHYTVDKYLRNQLRVDPVDGDLSSG